LKFSVYLLLFLFLNIPFKSTAQNNDFEAGLFNIGVGSVLGGVGAIINKEPEQKFGKTLLKGLGQGALGGYLVFESKRLVRKFSKSGNYNYVWPSKIVNSAGTSIIENAAANRDFWERWHLNIGFNRFEVNTKENFRLSYRIMPFNLLATGYYAISSKPDWDLSLKTGTFVFRTNKIEVGKELNYSGQTLGNVIVLLNNIQGKLSLPHELVHGYQFEQISGFNSMFIKTEKRYAENFPVLKTYQKIFHTDYHFVLGSLIYFISNPQLSHNGFIESEARYFGSSETITDIRYN